MRHKGDDMLEEKVTTLTSAQAHAIEQALHGACGMYGIDYRNPAQARRIEHRRIDANPLPTHEIAVDGAPVWRLSYTLDGFTIRSRAEWLVPIVTKEAP